MKIAEKTQIFFTVAKLGALLVIIITGIVALFLGTAYNDLFTLCMVILTVISTSRYH